jgi:hypothetical protein
LEPIEPNPFEMEAMTMPTAEHFRKSLSGAGKMFLLGLAIGACCEVFFGWRADVLDGLTSRAVLERAVKTGIGIALGFLIAKTLAGRLDFSALAGATMGLIFPAVYNLPIGAVIPSALLGGAWCGLLSRFELLPGFERQELELGKPIPEPSIDGENRELEESDHVH